MGDILQLGSQVLASVLKTSASQPITYDGTSLRATVGEIQSEETDAGGVAFLVRRLEFIVHRADMPEVPTRGKIIRYNGENYEVMGFGPTGPVADTVDRYGLMWRIHTQQAKQS